MYGVIAILENKKNGKFHPIIYHEKPFPGPYDENKPIRLKSKGHHTKGFKTRKDALKDIAENKKEWADVLLFGGSFKLELENDIIWTGEGIPADIILRTTEDFKKKIIYVSIKDVKVKDVIQLNEDDIVSFSTQSGGFSKKIHKDEIGRHQVIKKVNPKSISFMRRNTYSKKGYKSNRLTFKDNPIVTKIILDDE